MLAKGGSRFIGICFFKFPLSRMLIFSAYIAMTVFILLKVCQIIPNNIIFPRLYSSNPLPYYRYMIIGKSLVVFPQKIHIPQDGFIKPWQLVSD